MINLKELTEFYLKLKDLEIDYKELIKKYFLSILFLIIVLKAFFLIETLHYILAVLLIFIIFQKIKYFNEINKYIIYVNLFPVYCLLSSFWSLDPYWTFKRSVFLIIISLGLSISIFFYYKGKNFLINLLPANLLLIGLSLFSLIFNIPDDMWTGGNAMGFKGFAVHQNTLASLIIFTLPGIFLFKKNKLLISLLFIVSLIILLLTYSRASIISLLLMMIFYLTYENKKNLILLLTFLLLIVNSYFFLPGFKHTINKLLLKSGNHILERRSELWLASFNAAKLGNLFGLGYGISSPEVNISRYRLNNDGRIIREKGNSVLALIEEVGIIGLLIFLIPIGLAIKYSIKNYKNNINLIVLTMVLGMIIHAQFEAWWVGPGSVQYPLFLIYVNYLIFNNTLK